MRIRLSKQGIACFLTALLFSGFFFGLFSREVTAEAVDPVSALSLEEKKEDYEAFWDIVENAYPMLNFLRERGMDPEAIKEEHQDALAGLNTRESWLNFYDNIISELSLGGDQIGHLAMMRQGSSLLNYDFQSYCYYAAEEPDDPWLKMLDPIFQKAEVIAFYSLQEEPRDNDEEPPYYDVPDNLYMEYHPEANYAYVKIASFLNQNPDDADLLRDFFQEVERQKITNLILDVRGNQGGYNDYWILNIVAPNIKKMLRVDNYGLYKDNDWTRPYFDYYGSGSFEEDLEDLRDEDGKLPPMVFAWYKTDQDLPPMDYLSRPDVTGLDSIFVETIMVNPSEPKPLYTGDFWLLSDEGSYSASEYFLSFAKRTGFAKIVGQASGGDGSCVITVYSALPHTGALVYYNALYGLNPDGSSSEEASTPPDYPLADGQDAFWYVVDLIAEDKAA